MFNAKEYHRRWRDAQGEGLKKRQRQYYLEHREHMLEMGRRYRENHPQEQSKRAEQRKVRVLTYYGNGKCTCVKCGFSDIRALSLDHINNDGYKERKLRGQGWTFYKWLEKNGCPPGYQTLCYNCNQIKRRENKPPAKY